MKISIFGLGYVGAVSLACLARDGHDVIGVDIDPVKLDLIAAGKSPVIEAGMPELMADVVASGRVLVTTDSAQALMQSDVSFICVGTPALTNGNQDQNALLRLVARLGEELAKKPAYHLLVFRSTVTPGTVERTLRPLIEQHSGKKDGVDFDLCFQPEFLREGSSISDYSNPPFTVVGVETARAAQTLRILFEQLPGEFYETRIGTAEMMKYACNILHAVKISFANEIGRVCEVLQVDPHAVMELVCQDKQLNISPAYLKPGFAFGGSCLPKDLRAIAYMAKMHDVDIPMIGNVIASNNIHVEHAINKVLQSGKRKIGMIGLSFKSGTDDLRESPMVAMAEKFIGKGLNLEIYDPEVNVSRLIGANRRFIEDSIPHIEALMKDNCDRLIAESEVLVVGLSDSEIRRQIYQGLRTEQMVLDLVNMPGHEALSCDYHGVCW